MTSYFYKLPLQARSFTCCRENQVVLFFRSLDLSAASRICLPISQIRGAEIFPSLNLDIQGTKWNIAALRTMSVGDLIADLSIKGADKYPFPLIAVVQDFLGDEYLITCDEHKKISLSSMKHLTQHCVVHQHEQLVKLMGADPRNEKEESLSLCLALK